MATKAELEKQLATAEAKLSAVREFADSCDNTDNFKIIATVLREKMGES